MESYGIPVSDMVNESRASQYSRSSREKMLHPLQPTVTAQSARRFKARYCPASLRGWSSFPKDREGLTSHVAVKSGHIKRIHESP